MLSKTVLVFPLLSAINFLFIQAQSTINTNCPLLGPVYPSPSNVSTSAAVKSAQKAFEDGLQQAFLGGLIDNATTSFSLRVFSGSESSTLFDYHYEAPGLNGSLTAGSLDADTVYRVGSFSKLITAYAMMTQFGFSRAQDPITKYIPELAAAANNTDPLAVSWDDVTIDALMSHMAGVPRDISFGDLANENLPIGALGLPQLASSNVPTCGLGNNLTLCSRQQYFADVVGSDPVVATYDTPIYSNTGYVLLGYAIAQISGLSFEDFVNKSLIAPLKMSRTSFEAPENYTNSIIPGDPATSYFAADAGYYNPAGGAFTTLNDMTTLGQSILQSKLLRAPITRQWMKPRTHTSNVLQAVGAPWEIIRMPTPLSNSTNNTRLVDLYTKAGDIGAYSSMLILDADHNTGVSIIAAGLETHVTVNSLAELLTNAFVPAFEMAAAEEAMASYAGNFSSGNGNAASNITFVVDPARPGLGVTNWFSNGVDMFDTLLEFNNVTDPSYTASVRLYPNGISSKDKIAFRAIVEILPEIEDDSPFSENCETWVLVDQPKYGGFGLDDFLFELGDDGMANSVDIRGLRETLTKS